MHDNDQSAALQSQIEEALAQKTPLAIRGGGTKSFLGNPVEVAGVLDTSAHQGIVAYEPTELAITIRGGTRLQDVEKLLAENNQQFAFEPPGLGDAATIGGTVAAGLSGPRRPWSGSVADAVLGVKIINGKGEILEYGGRVMKNVAGYDVSRLMVGAMGTLGVLLEVSFKLQPVTPQSITLCQELSAGDALKKMREWARQNLVIDATAWLENRIYYRLSGNGTAVTHAEKKLGGDVVDDAQTFWQHLREQQHDFFHHGDYLWRLSLPVTTPQLETGMAQLIEWNGQQRWLAGSGKPAAEIREIAQGMGGHATLFRAATNSSIEPFHPLPDSLMHLHRRLKSSFDPSHIFNPGRMYAVL